jgi:hypothetical protein
LTIEHDKKWLFEHEGRGPRTYAMRYAEHIAEPLQQRIAELEKLAGELDYYKFERGCTDCHQQALRSDYVPHALLINE